MKMNSFKAWALIHRKDGMAFHCDSNRGTNHLKIFVTRASARIAKRDQQSVARVEIREVQEL
jgi:hypothetical protein